MSKHILVPTDGSTTALRAAQEVAALVGAAPDVQVTAVLAVEPLTTENTDLDAASPHHSLVAALIMNLVGMSAVVAYTAAIYRVRGGKVRRLQAAHG